MKSWLKAKQFYHDNIMMIIKVLSTLTIFMLAAVIFSPVGSLLLGLFGIGLCGFCLVLAFSTLSLFKKIDDVLYYRNEASIRDEDFWGAVKHRTSYSLMKSQFQRIEIEQIRGHFHLLLSERCFIGTMTSDFIRKHQYFFPNSRVPVMQIKPEFQKLLEELKHELHSVEQEHKVAFFDYPELEFDCPEFEYRVPHRKKLPHTELEWMIDFYLRYQEHHHSVCQLSETYFSIFDRYIKLLAEAKADTHRDNRPTA